MSAATTIETVPDPRNSASFLGRRITCSDCGPLDGLHHSEQSASQRSEGHLRAHGPTKTAQQEIYRLAVANGWRPMVPGSIDLTAPIDYRGVWFTKGERRIAVEYNAAGAATSLVVRGGSVGAGQIEVRQDRRAAALREIVFVGGAV